MTTCAPAWSSTTFTAMGSSVTLQIAGADESDTAERLRTATALIHRLERAWSRFDPASGLSRLNANPSTTVQVSPELALGVARALDAARASDGLVDPTLEGTLRGLGYDRTITSLPRPAAGSLPAGPTRSARAAGKRERWTSVEVDVATGTVRRPTGLALDLGGIGKGLAADLVVEAHADVLHVVAVIGGDLAAGGCDADTIVQPVIIASPRGDTELTRLELRRGGAATSGVTRRVWRGRDGAVMHHLLDPATGRSARTGIVQATALGVSGCDAERRAKQALLSGPAGCDAVLGLHGGVVAFEDGTTRVIEARS